jgi:hypothetical protein
LGSKLNIYYIFKFFEYVNAVNWAASFEALTERIGAALRVWKRGNVVDLISLGLLSSVERKSGW